MTATKITITHKNANTILIIRDAIKTFYGIKYSIKEEWNMGIEMKSNGLFTTTGELTLTMELWW